MSSAGRLTAPAAKRSPVPQGDVHGPVVAAVLAELVGAVERVDDPHPVGVEAARVLDALLGQHGVVRSGGGAAPRRGSGGWRGRRCPSPATAGAPGASARRGTPTSSCPASVASLAASWASALGAFIGRFVSVIVARRAAWRRAPACARLLRRRPAATRVDALAPRAARRRRRRRRRSVRARSPC